MKCFACRKPVTGNYLNINGYAYHPDCFTCELCGKPINESFLTHKHGFYHPLCYKKKLNLVCSHCGEPLYETWMEHQGKKYHRDCSPLRCSICNGPILDEYMEDENGCYHRKCFLDQKAPRCCICDLPITGKYIVDDWDNKAHHKHENDKTKLCEYCGRIISYGGSNGGYHYTDDRIVCGICKFSSIETDEQVEESLNHVLNLLTEPPAAFDGFPPHIPVQLVDRDTLKKIGGPIVPDTGEGLTRSETTHQNKKLIQQNFIIYILHGMPKLEFEAVLAHELIHVWLIRYNIDLPPKETEGFCDLAAALVYRSENSKLSNLLLKRMENRSDKIYGKGYRKMNTKLQKLGWKRLKDGLRPVAGR